LGGGWGEGGLAGFFFRLFSSNPKVLLSRVRKRVSGFFSGPCICVCELSFSFLVVGVFGFCVFRIGGSVCSRCLRASLSVFAPLFICLCFWHSQKRLSVVGRAFRVRLHDPFSSRNLLGAYSLGEASFGFVWRNGSSLYARYVCMYVRTYVRRCCIDVFGHDA